MTPPYITCGALVALAAGSLSLLHANEEHGRGIVVQAEQGALDDSFVFIQTNTKVEVPLQDGFSRDLKAAPGQPQEASFTTFKDCVDTYLSDAVGSPTPGSCGRLRLQLLQTNLLRPLIGPAFVVYAYLALCLTVVVVICLSVARTYTNKKLECPEEEAWKNGVLHWMWMGWATQWVVVWGNASGAKDAKIRADEMPVSFPEDDCALCYQSVQNLWDEEVAQNGIEQSSLLRVLLLFITYRKVIMLGLWNAALDAFLFLGPPVAVDWVTTYFRMLYEASLKGTVIPDVEKVSPTLMIMVIFTGLPLTMMVCNTVSTMLGSRMAIRISGGLSCLLFAKGQRLPLTPAHEDNSATSAAKILEAIEKENGGPSYGRGDEGRGKPRDKDQGTSDDEDPAKKLKRFNLVQLVSSDVNVNVMSIPLCIIKMVVMLPVLAILMVLLIRRLHLATIFTLGTAFLNVVILYPLGYQTKWALAQFYKSAGDRLQFFQQVMAGIRFVKSSGGELAVQRRLEAARAVELQWLQGYYNYLCAMLITITQFPKLYLLSSLGGYCLFHGTIEPTFIWSLATLLMSVQGAIGLVFNIIPTLVGAMPSFSRLETFLKLPEAPRASSLCSSERREEMEPAWVTIWPPVDAAAGGLSEPSALRVRGNFSWLPSEPPALRDLDITVPRGCSLAVVGQMGAGKTTLLGALLGELYPQEGSCIEVPRRVAYAAQVPHLFEGTLKENILQGERFDADRYKEALRAACLLPDLRVLPGGDEAPVGSRGIALSGGQKTRVSMARAAYCAGADAVLLDDPFGAVDACTAKHLDEHLLHGPILSGRTRVVVCQPNEERLANFDLVVVLSEGRVVSMGPPREVMSTNEFRKLLSTQQEHWDLIAAKASDEGCGHSKGSTSLATSSPDLGDHQSVFQLREEEFEGRASWSTLSYFFRMGGTWGVPGCTFFYFVKHLFEMAAQTTLANWTTQGATHKIGQRTTQPNPGTYLSFYVLWVCLSALAHLTSWACGQYSQLRCSKECHSGMVRSLLRAPTDGFFDRNPVGRIMNRMANDMMNMDQKVFIGLSSAMGVVIAVTVDLCYVHIMMPFWFTLISIPVYFLLACLLRLYWKTMIPLRYLCSVTRSMVSDQILNVEVNNASTRAYGKGNLTLALFQDALRKQISADFVGKTILMRWLCNRLFLLGGVFVTCITILVVWIPNALDVGKASLSVVLLFQLIVVVESYVTIGISAQYQIIAMNRLYEYTSLPEEREEELPGDSKYANLTVRAQRVDLGWLHSKEEDGCLMVIQGGPVGPDVPLLRQVPGKPSLQPVHGRTLADLAPNCHVLHTVTSWHRLAGVNGMHRTAKGIVDELCSGTSQGVTLYVESGWLADGVKVEIQKLRTGYAGVSKDILRSIDLIVPRRTRLAVVGKTGCGKSTMLLSLLRILEPRGGRVCLEGVDTQLVGLRTLRSAIGMVPQEPVLLQGPLRYNVDPLGQYDDSRIWDALTVVHLADHVRGLEGGLDFRIKEEGMNLSFGQRQLMNLARNVLRKPMLLLMDEATSALDPHSQELLQSTMEKAFPDSTMIVVAHRLETILDYDMVVVMHEGRIVEQGSVMELSCRCDGILAKMLHAANLL